MVNFLYSTPAQRSVLYELLCLPVKKQRPVQYPNQSVYFPQKVFSQQDFFMYAPLLGLEIWGEISDEKRSLM